ncbi:MAG TPA: TetR family transcriptional regulator [Stackebrandtia sp.]|jgi:TetR/AcrR family transcriptional repressor of nem operon|uniref:TetR/AcrR family transcriptional regulator n=1 Tax=Stackebrandtia sp. TaxID=2023065 RepID=UPI002D2C08F7|nr:TetR family transcriptional regulator [Stackebrandtia sp.]HZE39046.1 TetR family transcriptional regulator [Stackebrandtia sp.]
MARTKEFEPDVALRGAMELFLSRGYEATSMADLVSHLGISRASLYATFGHKDELYRKALDLYLRAQSIGPAYHLAQPGPVLPLIRSLMERYVSQVKQPNGSGGCLVVNAAIERMGADDAVARQVESSWAEVETALRLALVRAKAQGELPESADPRRLARFVLVVLQGLRVFARSDGDTSRLDDAVDETMRALS